MPPAPSSSEEDEDGPSGSPEAAPVQAEEGQGAAPPQGRLRCSLAPHSSSACNVGRHRAPAAGEEGSSDGEEGSSDEEHGSSSGEEEEGSSDGEEGPSSSSGGGAASPSSNGQPGWAARRGAAPEPKALQRRQKDGGKPTRTRINRFPKIPKHQRCGTCENCINPQRKKACSVARERLEAQQQQQERQQERGGAAAVSGDAFARALAPLLSNEGGVTQARHTPMLLKLLQQAKEVKHRTALLMALGRGSEEVQKEAVRGRALLTLQAWLTEYAASRNERMVARLLTCLGALPVTISALQPPCELGKAVGRLRKEGAFDEAQVREPARKLVAKWKAMVEQQQSGAGGGGSGGGVPRAAVPAAAAAAKPAAVVTPKPAAPAKPAAATPAAGGLLQQLQQQAARAALERQNSLIHDDSDMFRSADRQRSSVKEAVPSVKKVVHTVKTLPVEATRGGNKPGAAATPAAGSGASGGAGSPSKNGDAAAAAAAGQQQHSDAKPAPASAAAGAGAGGPSAAEVARISASPLGTLGGGSANVTLLGGGGGGGTLSLARAAPLMRTAAERAAEAARRVPSPEPQPRREKSKSVTWVGQDCLVAVRWFHKVDPPMAARQDADATTAPEAAVAEGREASPPGFENAAKREHLSEAEVLRKRHEEVDEAQHLLALMAPSTPWRAPPPSITPPCPAGPPGQGEESAEAAVAAARQRQEGPPFYPTLGSIPGCPAEPASAADRGQMAHPQHTRRIPLSAEEAAAPQLPPQAQQQQSMHSVHGVHGAPPGQLPPPLHMGMQLPPQQQAPVPMLPLASQQQQQQQQQQQGLAPAAAGRGGAAPDISATLAQLAASGILNPASLQQQQQGAGQPGMMPAMPGSNAPARPMFSSVMAPQPQGPPGMPGVQQQLPPHMQQQQAMEGGMGAPVQQYQQPPPHQQQWGMPQPQQQQLPPPQQQQQQWGPPPNQQQQQQWGAPPPNQNQQQQPQNWGPPQQQPPQQQQQQGPPPFQQQQQRDGGPQHEGPPRSRSRTPCRFFNTREGCWRGDTCHFAHIRDPGARPSSKRPADDRGGSSGGGGRDSGKHPRWEDRDRRGGGSSRGRD